MNFLLKYLIESSIIITVFYLIYIVIYNGDKNSKFNRLYLISSSLLAIIIPLLKVQILSTQEIIYPITLHQAIQLPEIIINENTAVLSTQAGFTLSQLIATVYLIGFTFFLGRLLYELFITYKYIRTYSEDSYKTNNYTLINTQGNLPTCSFFNYLFWDDSLTFNEKETNFIIKHEEGHILQNHTFDLIYLEILRIIFWFNPIMHGYKKAMLAVHEFLADEFAIANTNSQDFISLLARQVLQKYHLTLSNHFSKSQTIKRIKMIKSEKKKPTVLRWTVLVSLVIAMFYIFSCEQANEINQQDNDLTNLDESDKEALVAPMEVILGEDEIFTVVDDNPVPVSGLQAFYKYVGDNLVYPEEAVKAGIEGKVFIEFIVTKEGKISNVKCVRGISELCDSEAVKVVSNSPDWIPGEQKGNKVNVRMVMPITYQLD